MVFAGLRALETAGNQLGPASIGATLASPGADGGKAAAGGASPPPATPSIVGAQPSAPGAPANGASTNEAHFAAHSTFVKGQKRDFERNVRGSLYRTLPPPV